MSKHVGMWMNVDGEPVHMLADPDVSDETAAALSELVRHVRKLLDEGWRPKETMITGRRIYPNETGAMIFESGDYGLDPSDGEWWCRVPQSDEFHSGYSRLSAHTVVEHEDGTITVSPSILVTGHHDKQWHGYLERGIWREC